MIVNVRWQMRRPCRRKPPARMTSSFIVWWPIVFTPTAAKATGHSQFFNDHSKAYIWVNNAEPAKTVCPWKTLKNKTCFYCMLHSRPRSKLSRPQNTQFRQREDGAIWGKVTVTTSFYFLFFFFPKVVKTRMPPSLLASLPWTRCKVHARDSLDNNAQWKSKSSARAEAAERAFAEVTEGQASATARSSLSALQRVVNALLLSATLHPYHLTTPTSSSFCCLCRHPSVSPPAWPCPRQPRLSTASFSCRTFPSVCHRHFSSPASRSWHLEAFLTCAPPPWFFSLAHSQGLGRILIWKNLHSRPDNWTLMPPVLEHRGPIRSYRQHVCKLPMGKWAAPWSEMTRRC